MNFGYLLIISFALHVPLPAVAQDVSPSTLTTYSNDLFAGLDQKSGIITEKFHATTQKYLQRIARLERKLQKRLQRKDSLAASRLFNDAIRQYPFVQQQALLNSPENVYSGHLDSLRTALLFLQAKSLKAPARLQETLLKIDELQNALNQSAAIRKSLLARMRFLQENLPLAGLGNRVKKLRQEIGYYQMQAKKYKALIENPQRSETVLLQALCNNKLFRNFFAKHAALAGLFRVPGNDAGLFEEPVVAGLQTRAAMQEVIQQRFGAGPAVPQMVRDNMQSAKEQLLQLKNKLSGQDGNDLEMPGFKPNQQKTKSLFDRIEYSTDLQTVRSNYFFPVTTDIGLSAAYRINEKSTAGLGMSYKIGLGKDFRHIAFSSQGIGFRSFAEIVLKGSFHATGGFEYNYRRPFSSLREIKQDGLWQQSGLIGISKIVSLQSKLFKKTKLQVLWDFLGRQQTPPAQELLFRFGYNF